MENSFKLFLALTDISLYALGMVLMYGHFAEIERSLNNSGKEFTKTHQRLLLWLWPVVATEYLIVTAFGRKEE